MPKIVNIPFYRIQSKILFSSLSWNIAFILKVHKYLWQIPNLFSTLKHYFIHNDLYTKKETHTQTCVLYLRPHSNGAE